MDADGRVYRPNVWQVLSEYPFEQLKRDDAWDGISSSVLWDPDGEWAVVVSNEGLGVIAGSPDFVEQLQRELPGEADDLSEIVERSRGGRSWSDADDARFFGMIAQLYGEAEARRAFGALSD